MVHDIEGWLTSRRKYHCEESSINFSCVPILVVLFVIAIRHS